MGGHAEERTLGARKMEVIFACAGMGDRPSSREGENKFARPRVKRPTRGRKALRTKMRQAVGFAGPSCWWAMELIKLGLYWA